MLRLDYMHLSMLSSQSEQTAHRGVLPLLYAGLLYRGSNDGRNNNNNLFGLRFGTKTDQALLDLFYDKVAWEG